MKSYNVLVVDDDEMIRKLLYDILSRFSPETVCNKIKNYYTDVSVKCVESSEAAIKEIKRNNYNLILLDIHLGEEKANGVETLKSIREIKPEQNVYMITGYPVEDEENRIINKNALGTLNKPFKLERLSGIICELVNRENG